MAGYVRHVASTIELVPGQELTLTAGDERPLTRLRVGLGWDKERTAGAIGTGAPDVDLDASAVQFSGGQLFDLAFYNNLRTRDGSVVHLGDNQTGRGEGDDEVITVDLTRVYAKVDAIVLMVSSYQGHTLEWVNHAYVSLFDEVGERELARFTLTGGVPHTGLAMAKLFRAPAEIPETAGTAGTAMTADPTPWRLKAIGEGIHATVPTESVAALQRFV